MSWISIVGLGLSVAFMLAAAVLFFLSRRRVSQQSPEEGQPWRAAEDRSGRILWELGRDWPLVDPQTNKSKLTRRGFVPRFALGIFAAMAGWAVARGWADTPPLSKTAGPGTDGPAPRKETNSNTQIATNAQQDHNDSHNDFETHGDNLTPHQDAYPRPGVHFDVPHYDQDTGHFDLHNDA